LYTTQILFYFFDDHVALNKFYKVSFKIRIKDDKPKFLYIVMLVSRVNEYHFAKATLLRIAIWPRNPNLM
jgi:hypothetical protein